MRPEIGSKYLITTDSWFFANDGNQYKAVFGEITSIRDAEDTLGVKTNARSTNWYVLIGNKDENLLIAGCQIHYAMKTDKLTNVITTGEQIFEGKLYEIEYKTPRIFVFK